MTLVPDSVLDSQLTQVLAGPPRRARHVRLSLPCAQRVQDRLKLFLLGALACGDGFAYAVERAGHGHSMPHG